jgi:hypothetical protein
LINFRYHIVSLMAIFLALAVGITLGVTLVSDEANKGLAAQAEQDREQVQLYRQQLEQQRALNNYRDSYEQLLGGAVTAGMLSGVSVAVIAMPDAPRATVREIEQSIGESGGTLTSRAEVGADVFDPTQADAVRDAIDEFSNQYDSEATLSTQVGTVLARSLLSAQGGMVDPLGLDIGDALGQRLVRIDRQSDQAAELAVIVSAPAADPPLVAEELGQHVEFALALYQRSGALVLAGPNSAGIDGTDVATARSDPAGREQLSTVDVADLPSGISTVVMAGREQLNGGQGHYGYANSSDAPAPELPIR